MAFRVLGYVWTSFVSQWPTIVSHAEGAAQRIQNSELSDIVRDLSSFSLRMFLRFMQLAIALLLLLTSASAVYACFYYLVMPTKILHRPVYFDYGVHSLVLQSNEHMQYHGHNIPIQLPTAILDLAPGKHGRDQWTYVDELEKPLAPLTPGAKYDFVLEFDFAQSDTNVEIGMFMVRTELVSDANVTARSARPAFVRPGHWVVDVSSRLLWMLPTLALGHDASLTQSQIVLAVNGYQDIRDRPVTGVHVQLSHPRVQVARATLSVIAQLSGLRYLMYHWFSLTSTIAIVNIACVEVFGCFVFYLYLTFPSVEDDVEGDGDDGDDAIKEILDDDIVHFGPDEVQDDEDALPPVYETDMFTAETTSHLRQRQPTQRAAKAI
ncbi:Aste57867_21440 [Aphanomyces stellatus]|uniref:Aste57867_21440 protein n=1 Tax=Aphanomyces stellatus TaxID=120398 RepID=A0A485LHJ8_9STRA|nr:hypothetical protein As57867_021371 [Aphanomyces stellatus]VFT98111.1 Aste57867_21440 [Aphanomyces stellatus]